MVRLEHQGSISDLLAGTPTPTWQDTWQDTDTFNAELADMINYLKKHTLPTKKHTLPIDQRRVQRILSQSPLFTLVNDILCFTKGFTTPCTVVPSHLRRQLMDEGHRRP